MLWLWAAAAGLAWSQSPAAPSAQFQADGTIVISAPAEGGSLRLTFEAGRPDGPARLLKAELSAPAGVRALPAEGAFDGRTAEGTIRPEGAAASAFRLVLPAATTPARDAARAARVERALDRMSVERRIGQLLMIAVDEELAVKYDIDIRDGRLGGGLLRWDKFSGPQARDFSERMQALAGGPGFLIAADHEGGAVFTQRSYGATLFPGNMALGATASESYAERAAQASGRELKALGIHMTFAPVLDVNSDPTNPIIGVRSFGEVPGEVARLGAASVRGYESAGLLAVAKHYPGHGDTGTDSHRKLPVIDKDIPALSAVDLVPFKAAVDAGLSAIMPAHILFPALDPDNPVTLSNKALGGLRALGFDGLVVSDSMDMGAITESHGAGAAAVRAVQAGVDLLLLGKGAPREAFQALLAAVREGALPSARLDEAVRRVLAAKDKAGLLGAPAKRPPLETVGRPEHAALAQEIADHAITVLRDADGALPLRPRPEQKLLVIALHAGRHESELNGLFAEFAARHANLETRLLGHKPDEASIAAAADAAASADLVVVGTYDWGAAGYAEQEALAKRLVAAGKPLVLASLMNPYDLRKFPEVRTAVASYGITPVSMRALVKVLFGEIPPRGRLPVTIPSPAS